MISVVTTSKRNWGVGIDAWHGNPYDGSTLKRTLEQVDRVAAIKPTEAFFDRGYRGSQHHPEGVAVFVSGRRGLRGVLYRALKRRATIEPMIGHIKQEHGMGRNYLLGREGDRINTLLSECGMNMRKLLRTFFLRIFGIDLSIAKMRLFNSSNFEYFPRSLRKLTFQGRLCMIRYSFCQ